MIINLSITEKLLVVSFVFLVLSYLFTIFLLIKGHLMLYVISLIVTFLLTFKFLTHLEGFYSERKVLKYLMQNSKSFFGKDFSIFRGACFPNIYGDIDFLVVCNKGIFVIEVKNLHGKYLIKDDNWFVYRRRKWIRKDKNISKELLAISMKVKDLIREIKNVWIYPVLILTNEKVKIEVKNSKVDILFLKDLKRFVETKKKVMLTKEEISRIIKKISESAIKMNSWRIALVRYFDQLIRFLTKY